VLSVLDDAVAEILHALEGVDDWRPAGDRAGQYRIDLVADAAATPVLLGAGLGVVSEESGAHATERDVVVVMDPVDGSTNAAHQIPWYAASLCAVDGDGLLAAVVTNLATGERFAAVRGEGATCDGEPCQPSGCDRLGDAIVALASIPPAPLGWRQCRGLGAAALDLCAVAAGRLDGYLACTRDAHGAWDYLGGMLVCAEAGAVTADAFARDLLTLEWTDRRTPLAAATPSLLDELRSARASFE
jgi:fructose-1,6-bisphosphatase/inositol monophosphatase family enzyme